MSESVRAESVGVLLGLVSRTMIMLEVVKSLEIALWCPGGSHTPSSSRRELEWGTVLAEFLRLDTDGDRRLTPEQLMLLFNKLKVGYSMEQFFIGLRHADLLDDEDMIPLDGEDGFTEFWCSCHFGDPFGVIQKRRIQGLHYRDETFGLSSRRGSQADLPVVEDQSTWKVPHDEEDEEYEEDAAQVYARSSTLVMIFLHLGGETRRKLTCRGNRRKCTAGL